MGVPFSWSNWNDASRSLHELNKEISEKIGSIVIDAIHPDEFRASIYKRCFGKFGITSVHSGPHRIFQREIRRVDAYNVRFSFYYIRDGVFIVEQNNRHVVAGPGEFVLVDNFLSFECMTSMNGRCISLDVPENWLNGQLRNPTASVMVPVRKNDIWVRTLGAMLSAIDDSYDQGEFSQQGIILDQIGGFVTLIFEKNPEIMSAHRAKIYQNIIECLRYHYNDVNISPGLIAKLVGISERSLYLTLAAAGTTFSKELARFRIDRACKLLNDPNFNKLSIAEIGWRSGFSDPSYFSRCFNRQLNCTPRKFRYKNIN